MNILFHHGLHARTPHIHALLSHSTPPHPSPPHRTPPATRHPQPPNGGYPALMLTPEVPMPMIARCPAGTSSHGGWVRAQDPLPHGGRHYWEVSGWVLF